jgi:acetylornithine deacetylase
MTGDAVPTQTTLDHLARLIGFDSVSRNSNLALIDWARALLEQAGARTRTSFNAERSKANLFATFGEGSGGLVLSGHTDVVPVDGQNWTSDPFRAEIRGGKLYGRGACDMKGFVAVALSRAPVLARQSAAPVHVALTYDEEQGCLGIPVLLADLAEAGIRPACCVVGEPTSMKLVASHKGGRIYRAHIRGRAAHSSLTPQAVNAIEYAGRVAAFIQSLADGWRENGPFEEGFDVTHSTISINLIEGGNGPNIVPARCEMLFEHRFLPGTDPEGAIRAIDDFVRRELLPRMQAVDPETGVSFECVGRIPALAARTEAPVLAAAQETLGQPAPQKVAYGTEAAFFQAAGIDAIVCGPGSIAQAHRADEFVPLSELAACESFLDGLWERLAAVL